MFRKFLKKTYWSKPKCLRAEDNLQTLEEKQKVQFLKNEMSYRYETKNLTKRKNFIKKKEEC